MEIIVTNDLDGSVNDRRMPSHRKLGSGPKKKRLAEAFLF